MKDKFFRQMLAVDRLTTFFSSSLSSEVFLLLIEHLCKEAADVLTMLLAQILVTVPLLDLVRDEALALLDRVLTVFATDHLHGPCDSSVVAIEHVQSAAERLRRSNVVSDGHVRGALCELKHIVGAVVELLDLVEAQVVRVSIVSIIPLALVVREAVNDVDNNF